MSSNLDKIVKLACKPKNAPPKAKYVDVLVAATYAEDGSLNDVVRSLSLRIREPNVVVVFKALLTLHQMIRSGSTDQLLELLSQGDSLRLGNVGSQSWEGYSPPSNMGSYAHYLDVRIKSWREMKHDVLRIQTESNRRSDGLGAGSKARRLRHLPVEKGLLREVKQIQRVLDALVMCRFYDDDLRDENTVLAFRMLIKDLLVLFQAGNEGVCNILEHYFEMSKPDASESFDIYKSFIKQTDKVVDYLGVVRKLHNVVNIPVPNLKHAPTSLVKALEEYLNDPNFEENRREYKKSLGVVEGKPGRTPSPNPPASQTEEPKPAPSSSLISAPPVTSSSPVSAPAGAPQKIQDFFDSIQAEQQPTMFGGPAQSFPQQGQMQMGGPAFNPFRQSMVMMPQQTGFMQPQMTGFGGFPQQQPQGFMQPQMTGAMAFGGMGGAGGFGGQQAAPFNPQPTGAFGQQSAPQQQQQQQQPFMQSQPTGFNPQQPNFAQPQPLQAQATGSNPFRQSMMPINTNVTGINPSGALSQPASPFHNQNPTVGSSNAFGSGGGQSQIQRPGSTPALSLDTKPLVAQATGSKNPFAPPGGVQKAPPMPQQKGPSMNELVWNKQQSQFGMPPQQTGMNGGGGSGPTSPSPWNNGASMNGKPGGSGISDIASSFTFDNNKPTSNGSSDFSSQFGGLSTTGTGGGTASTSQFGSLSNPTGQMSPTKTGGSAGFLQPQATGFGGSTVKRFQPTSSFGSQLMETLPPIQEPGTNTPGGGGMTSPSKQPQAGQSAFSFDGTGGQGQGQAQTSLSPQATGAPNPFRQSILGGGMGAQPTGQAQGGAGQNAFGGAFGSGSNATSGAFGGGAGGAGGIGQFGGMGNPGGAFGAMSPFAGQNARPQQQQQQQGMGMFGQQTGQGQGQGGNLI